MPTKSFALPESDIFSPSDLKLYQPFLKHICGDNYDCSSGIGVNDFEMIFPSLQKVFFNNYSRACKAASDGSRPRLVTPFKAGLPKNTVGHVLAVAISIKSAEIIFRSDNFESCDNPVFDGRIGKTLQPFQDFFKQLSANLGVFDDQDIVVTEGESITDCTLAFHAKSGKELCDRITAVLRTDDLDSFKEELSDLTHYYKDLQHRLTKRLLQQPFTILTASDESIHGTIAPPSIFTGLTDKNKDWVLISALISTGYSNSRHFISLIKNLLSVQLGETGHVTSTFVYEDIKDFGKLKNGMLEKLEILCQHLKIESHSAREKISDFFDLISTSCAEAQRNDVFELSFTTSSIDLFQMLRYAETSGFSRELCQSINCGALEEASPPTHADTIAQSPADQVGSKRTAPPAEGEPPRKRGKVLNVLNFAKAMRSIHQLCLFAPTNRRQFPESISNTIGLLYATITTEPPKASYQNLFLYCVLLTSDQEYFRENYQKIYQSFTTIIDHVKALDPYPVYAQGFVTTITSAIKPCDDDETVLGSPARIAQIIAQPANASWLDEMINVSTSTDTTRTCRK